MTQLEFDIAELEKKQQAEGLTAAEKVKLLQLQEEWYEIESAKYGQCRSCFM